MKKIIPLFALSASTLQGLIFDDFSLGFDNNKWVEKQNQGAELIQEHYVDAVLQNYHTAQLTAGDKRIELISKQLLNQGEQLDFDFNYVSGTGNNFTSFLLNGMTFDLRMNSIDNYVLPPEFQIQGSGAIGYWNGVKEWGNEFGIYHVNLKFNNDTADLTLIKPDDSTINYTTTQLTYPLEFGIVSIVGHDGTIHVDYDNFGISIIPEANNLYLPLGLGLCGILLRERQKRKID